MATKATIYKTYLNIEGDIELLPQKGMSSQCNMMDRELTLLDDTNSISIT